MTTQISVQNSERLKDVCSNGHKGLYPTKCLSTVGSGVIYKVSIGYLCAFFCLLIVWDYFLLFSLGNTFQRDLRRSVWRAGANTQLFTRSRIGQLLVATVVVGTRDTTVSKAAKLSLLMKLAFRWRHFLFYRHVTLNVPHLVWSSGGIISVCW